jgi:hypothetical protein
MAASAQVSPGRIEGVVKDNVGVIPGARIVLQRVDSPDPVASAGTDSEGRFVLARISPGRYILHAGAPGYIDEPADLVVQPDATTTLALNLRPRPPRFDPVELHVSEVVGPVAYSCGRIRTVAPVTLTQLRLIVSCARRVAGQPAAFAAIVERPSIDSDVADGLIGRSDGQILYFRFDSHPYAASTGRATFETSPCPRPDVVEGTRPESGAQFVCR